MFFLNLVRELLLLFLELSKTLVVDQIYFLLASVLCDLFIKVAKPENYPRLVEHTLQILCLLNVLILL